MTLIKRLEIKSEDELANELLELSKKYKIIQVIRTSKFWDKITDNIIRVANYIILYEEN